MLRIISILFIVFACISFVVGVLIREHYISISANAMTLLNLTNTSLLFSIALSLLIKKDK